MAQEAQTQKDEAALTELVADLCPPAGILRGACADRGLQTG